MHFLEWKCMNQLRSHWRLALPTDIQFGKFRACWFPENITTEEEIKGGNDNNINVDEIKRSPKQPSQNPIILCIISRKHARVLDRNYARFACMKHKIVWFLRMTSSPPQIHRGKSDQGEENHFFNFSSSLFYICLYFFWNENFAKMLCYDSHWSRVLLVRI